MKDLVPHYVAMLLPVFGLLTVVRATVDETGFWVELAIVAILALASRPVAGRLEIAPSARG